jgi:hypothetical protein
VLPTARETQTATIAVINADMPIARNSAVEFPYQATRVP